MDYVTKQLLEVLIFKANIKKKIPTKGRNLMLRLLGRHLLLSMPSGPRGKETELKGATPSCALSTEADRWAHTIGRSLELRP